MRHLPFLIIGGPLILLCFFLVWYSSWLRRNTLSFLSRLKKCAPEEASKFGNTELGYWANNAEFLRYVLSRRYAELGNPSITNLGDNVKLLHLCVVYIRVALGAYFAFFVIYVSFMHK